MSWKLNVRCEKCGQRSEFLRDSNLKIGDEVYQEVEPKHGVVIMIEGPEDKILVRWGERPLLATWETLENLTRYSEQLFCENCGSELKWET